MFLDGKRWYNTFQFQIRRRSQPTRLNKTRRNCQMQQAEKTQLSILFLIITCLFITCLLITNVSAGRLIQFMGLPLTADLFLFPITYIFGDVLTEVYGFQKARLTIWLGFGANLLMALFSSSLFICLILISGNSMMLTILSWVLPPGWFWHLYAPIC